MRVWLCIEKRNDGPAISNLPGGPDHCFFNGYDRDHLPDCGWKRVVTKLGVSVDALVIEKDADGRWPIGAVGAMAGVYYGMTSQGGLLADVFVAQLDALADQVGEPG